jgi:hypothetical protein
MLFKRIFIATLLAFSSLLMTVVLAPSAHAVSASDWQAGRIIDDTLFTNPNGMTVDQIQDFLNRYVGTSGNGVPGQCDTNGVRLSEFGGGTRAEYGASRGNPAPFTCLKDFYEVPKINPGPGIPANNYGGKPIPAGAKSAAQLIWDAAQRYSINPKVLLVTIQKESAGPLTTDDWPFLKQYTYAMGAHCPDSGPGGSANCDEDYAGFSLQISESARLFRYYLDNMNQSWWPYKKPGNNNVLYHPNSACGSSNIYITTRATAALYTYTPYQPNQAALNNLYGTGDSCSAYGNRNFWRIFSDWFGSTTRPNGEISISGALSTSDTSPVVGQQLTLSYTVQNLANYSVDTGVLWICGDMNGQPFGGGSNRKVLAPGETLTMTMTYVPQISGALKIMACGDIPNGPGWTTNYPYALYSDHRERWDLVNGNPMIISWAVNSSNTSPGVGETVTLAYGVKNNYNANLDTGVLWICGDMNGQPFGGGSNRKVLAPGEVLIMTMPYTPQTSGRITVSVCGNTPDGPGWTPGYPYGDYADHSLRTYSIAP